MRKQIVILVDESEKIEVGEMIHKQLVGNIDYIKSNILLNVDAPGEIHLWVMDEAKPFEIKLTL